MNKQISVFSGVCIRDKKVLMVLRDEEENPDAHLKWEFPGGKCDFDETPQASLKRELLEEAGVDVIVTDLLPYVQTSYWDYAWGKQQTLCFLFLCEFVAERTVLKNDHHVKEIRWLTADEARTVPSLPGTIEIIDLVEEMKLL